MNEEEFTVRSIQSDDPDRVKIRAARDKVKANEGPSLQLLHQLPNENSPIRFLVKGNEQYVRALLAEYSPAVKIEPNNKIQLSDPEYNPMATNRKGSSTRPSQAVKSETTASPEESVKAKPNVGAEIISESKENQTKSTASIQVLQSKPKEFIFSPKRTHGYMGLQMLSNSGTDLVRNLKAFSGLDIEIIATRKAFGINPQSLGGAPSNALLVRIDEDKGQQFVQQSILSSSPIWVDENHKIYSHGDTLLKHFSAPDFISLSDGGMASRFDILVIGEENKALSNASVRIYSTILLQPTNAVTNADGIVSFQLPNAVIASIAGIVVEPQSMYWSKIIRNPQLTLGQTNTIRVQSYAEFDKNFSSSGALSWGLGKLRVSEGITLNGGGVKIGIIDSGCDASHSMLQHVTRGIDFNPGATTNSWRTDEIGHGTHVAGIIGARFSDHDRFFRGVAPNAELLIYKIFPKGDFFTLGGALEAAIADGVDIINMSLGSKDQSNDIAENIIRAKEAGITCFVAAGNSGDAVQFPANLTTSIAVSALGYKSAIPGDSVSANTFLPAFSTPEGFFSPSFTCFGESIDFTGPGVGIISTVPQNGLKALDGTSMATPHLAGMAALHLGHNPVVRDMPRSSARVDYIYNLLKQSANPMPFTIDRVGLGMPRMELNSSANNIASLNPGFVPLFWGSGGGGFSGGGASTAW